MSVISKHDLIQTPTSATETVIFVLFGILLILIPDIVLFAQITTTDGNDEIAGMSAYIVSFLRVFGAGVVIRTLQDRQLTRFFVELPIEKQHEEIDKPLCK